jgi:mannan endo-1,4-beta-mannosidase
LIAGGTTQINDGPNGLQKLDIILQLAQKHGIFVILSLTNNWDPRASGAHFNTPRNFLSNDYGAYPPLIPPRAPGFADSLCM